MLHNLDLTKILFLDIETVPQVSNYSELPEDTAALWDEKATKLSRNEQTGEEMFQRAGIYAEFGKIICVWFLCYAKVEKEKFRMQSFYGDDEKLASAIL